MKNYYNDQNCSSERRGIAYCIRKGKIASIPYDLEGATLIDGMKHAEISKVFKDSKYFISFDRNTAFSRFAALCGCISIVVPEEGVDEQAWQPVKENRYGISYGFDDEKIKQALSTVGKLKRQVLKEENDSEIVVKNFIEEAQNFFFKRDNHLI